MQRKARPARCSHAHQTCPTLVSALSYSDNFLLCEVLLAVRKARPDEVPADGVVTGWVPSPPSGVPARGYGWPPFAPGHEMSVTHGARSERKFGPVAELFVAALMNDLAARKRMSLSSCLEEILLHTCQPLGDGVASPHTSGDLRYIQDLKKKHGIDYDSHGSYRFVEE